MEHKTLNKPTEPKAKKGSDSARTPEPSTPLGEFPKEIGASPTDIPTILTEIQEFPMVVDDLPTKIHKFCKNADEFIKELGESS